MTCHISKATCKKTGFTLHRPQFPKRTPLQEFMDGDFGDVTTMVMFFKNQHGWQTGSFGDDERAAIEVLKMCRDMEAGILSMYGGGNE